MTELPRQETSSENYNPLNPIQTIDASYDTIPECNLHHEYFSPGDMHGEPRCNYANLPVRDQNEAEKRTSCDRHLASEQEASLEQNINGSTNLYELQGEELKRSVDEYGYVILEKAQKPRHDEFKDRNVDESGYLILEETSL